MGLDVEFKELVGKTLVYINVNGDEIYFETDAGEEYLMHHSQDCCESVDIEDITGDLEDLLNSPILQAEESTSYTNPEGIIPSYQDSFTWTFYKLATVKGYVTIRWYGNSNGYYSERVDFERVK